MKPGTVYALYGEDGWIYWAQVKSELDVGFFRFRSKDVEETDAALSAPIMFELTVGHPSIGGALRAGVWKKIGVRAIGEDLSKLRWKAHWSEGDDFVTVSKSKGLTPVESYKTAPDDPKIQDLETVAAWDAEYHVPNRVVAEFENDSTLNKWGGTVELARQRRG